MKIKIFTALTALFVLSMIIYSEYNKDPYSNIEFVTNNNSNNSINTDDIITSSDHQNNQSNRTVELPDFKLHVISSSNKNKFTNIKNIKSDNIIIHFWASWCNICTSEFKDIIAFSKNHKNTTIVAISIDEDYESLQKYIKLLNNNYNINNLDNLIFAWDQNKDISIDIFNTDMVPENYIVKHHDSHYEITEKVIGLSDWNKIISN